MADYLKTSTLFAPFWGWEVYTSVFGIHILRAWWNVPSVICSFMVIINICDVPSLMQTKVVVLKNSTSFKQPELRNTKQIEIERYTFNWLVLQEKPLSNIKYLPEIWSSINSRIKKTLCTMQSNYSLRVLRKFQVDRFHTMSHFWLKIFTCGHRQKHWMIEGAKMCF